MSETPPETEPTVETEPEVQHDAVLPTPGAPITVHADWHNAPGTGRYEPPPVETVTAYEKDGEDGPLVAKVLKPPARPRPTRGRRASTPKTGAEQDDDGQDDDGQDDEAA